MEIDKDQIKIKDILPFVKVQLSGGTEIGIANGYFAGDAWKISDEAYEQISGRSFGWMDSQGGEYCEDRSKMSRPTEDEVKHTLSQRYSEHLLDVCVERGYVEI